MNETTLPADWGMLCLVVFMLGMRHGFDADHLATIDGLTRFNAQRSPRLAKLCGLLFSVGHGLVVVAIALAVNGFASVRAVPEWLAGFGAWTSIVILVLLGLANLYTVLHTPSHAVVAPVGLRGRFLGRFARAESAIGVALVGALFALSFDTVSQAMLFAMAASQFGGWHAALAIGIVFLLGMLLVDGINGWWISRLLRRADRMALVASRIMGVTVAMLSLLVAAYGVLRLAVPGVAAWGEGRELLMGASVVAIIAACFLLGWWLAGNPARPVAQRP